MSSRVSSYAQSPNLIEPFAVASSLSSFKNHQKWEISRKLDIKTGSPIFYVKDTHGLSYEITEYVVESIDHSLIQEITQLNTEEEHLQRISQYLQERLDRATPYQVHIERFRDKWIIRFGEYGLKGGGKDEWLFVSGSVAQVAGGIFLCVSPSKAAKIAGAALISSGVNSGLYAIEQKKEDFKAKNYGWKALVGGLSGVITGAAGVFANGFETIWRVGCLALGGGASGAVTTVAAEFIEKQKLPEKEKFLKNTRIGLLGGGVSAGLGVGFERVAGETDAVLYQILSKATEGGVTSVGSKIATNLCDSDVKNITEGVLQSGLIGFLLSGAISFADLHQKNSLKNQVDQTEETVRAAREKTETAKRELQSLEESLKQSEQDLIDKQTAFKQAQQKALENQEKTLKGLQEIHQTTQSIGEAQKTAEAAKLQLEIDQKAILQASQQVLNNKQSLLEAQKNALLTQQQLRAAEQLALKANQDYAKVIAAIDKDIDAHLKKGYKANIKVNGKNKYTKDPAKIRDAYQNGKTVEWKKGPNRILGSREKVRISPFQKDSGPQELVDKTQQKLSELKASIEQKQIELKAAQDQLAEQQQSAVQTQEGLKSAQQIQQKRADLTKLQDQIRQTQELHKRAIQEMIATKKTVAQLELEASKVKGKISDAQGDVKAVSNFEKELAALLRDLQAAVAAAKQNFNHLLCLSHNRGDLNDPLKPEIPLPNKKIRDVSELESHMVLVHAIQNETALHFINRYDENDPKRAELTEQIFNDNDLNARYRLCINADLTPEGILAPHLQRREKFEDPYIARPQIHWSCNQLVQPVDKDMNQWEDANIAVLEPLSMFGKGGENNHKPYGIATYDTMTFGSHHLSERSTLLIPHELLRDEADYNRLAQFLDENSPIFLIPNENGCADKVKRALNLEKFKGQIVTYNQTYIEGKGQNLRAAVMHVLKKSYPDTWHICEEDVQGEKPEETGWKMLKPNGSGRRKFTSLISPDGGRHMLYKIDGERISVESDVFQAFSEKRHNDFHIRSATYYFEDERECYIVSLRDVIQNIDNLKSIKNNNKPAYACYAGGIKNENSLESLGSSKMLRTCQFLEMLPQDTGAREEAKYYLDRAMYADLISLFFESNPEGKFDLFTPDLRIIFDSERVNLIKSLETIGDANSTSEEKQNAFEEYCKTLKECHRDMQLAKQDAALVRSVEEDESDDKVSHLCRVAGQTEWERIGDPTDTNFNLRKSWPFSEELGAYIFKVRAALPKKCEELKELYRKLLTDKPTERKEQYRLNILLEVIQFSIQEENYLARRMNGVSSILLKVLSRYGDPLAKYGLQPEDKTKKPGDCLFDNVAFQVGSDGGSIRKRMVEFLKANHEEYSNLIASHNKVEVEGTEFKYYLEKGIGENRVFFQTWEEYLVQIGTPTVWATEFEIHALAHSLNQPIVLLVEGKLPRVYNLESENEPVFLQQINGNHFIAGVPREGITKKKSFELIKRDSEDR